MAKAENMKMVKKTGHRRTFWKKLAAVAMGITVLAGAGAQNCVRTEAANYNGQAAANWAVSNYSGQSNSRACTSFANDAMAAGGIHMSFEEYRYPNRILETVQRKNLGTIYDVSSVHAGMISPGDLVTWCCNNHGSAAHPLYGLHVGVITGVNTGNQTVRYTCTNNKHDVWISLGNLKRMSGADRCGSSHLVCQIIHFTGNTGSSGAADASTVPSQTNPWSYSATPTACYGTQLVNQYWPKVQWIQQALNVIQSAGLTVDGHFGNSTRNAAVAFQRSHGLTADGIVGPGTANKMAECLHSMGYHE